MMSMRRLITMTVLGCAISAPAMADPPKREVAILAGGCFWGMEKVMMQLPGVIDAEVGYAGGKSTTVTYHDVGSGTTGHAEAVRVVYDPAKISYEQVLHWYLRGHDPTQVDRQNNDIGPQYRSEIFAMDDTQLAVAMKVKTQANHSGKFAKPLATKIERATTWVKAEDYHQDYLVKHPNGYNDHWLRAFDF
jgi:peptide methionine sulfoxide reductase msrA/msrB